MEPRQDGVVTRRSVGIVAGVPNRVLVGASQNDDEPDVAGVEGAPLDTRQWERGDDICRYVFYVRRRKVAVWFGDSEHIQYQTLSRGQLVDSIPVITLFGKYRYWISVAVIMITVIICIIPEDNISIFVCNPMLV